MRRDPEFWQRFFHVMALHVATASKDPSTKCGSVIVDAERRVLGLGYNGFPRGVRDDDERYDDRALKYKLVVHAEANAILNAVGGVGGCTLFSTKFPCTECAKLIIQAGIATVVSPPIDRDPACRWSEDQRLSRMMFLEAEVEMVELESP